MCTYGLFVLRRRCRRRAMNPFALCVYATFGCAAADTTGPDVVVDVVVVVRRARTVDKYTGSMCGCSQLCTSVIRRLTIILWHVRG